MEYSSTNIIDRENFINKILVELEMNNYGFKIENMASSQKVGYNINDPLQMKAIKELIIRLNVWKILGKKDEGIIEYPEAKRRIVYNLDDKSIKKCKIILQHC